MWQAKVGTVFAVRIESDKWGFVRFGRGLAMGILSVYQTSPEMPNLDWKSPPVKWYAFSFAPDADTTEAILLRTVQFENEESEWGPPCYSPPDAIDKYYRIFERGRMRKGTEKDVTGMLPCQTFKPADLAEFLSERLKAGELRKL
jgi:hypothetical protein